jgi:hypothetical protein
MKKRFLLSVSLTALTVMGSAVVSASAADEIAQGSSSSSSYSSSGVGFKGANTFAPKYKERIGNYREQIQMGRTKGWLTSAQADHFDAELDRLTALEAKAAAANYAQAELTAVEKAFTTFNIELSSASTAGAKPAAATTTKTTTTTPAKTTTTTSVKPAAPAAKKTTVQTKSTKAVTTTKKTN